MRIKSYFANSVQAAIRQAREELGSDAVLIESHAAPEESRRLGEFEVVCGIVDAAARPNKAKRAQNTPAQDDLAAELKMLRAQMDDLRGMLQPAGAAAPPTDVDEIREELIAADLDPDLAGALVDMANAVRRSAGPQRNAAPVTGKDALRRIVEASILGRLQGGAPPASIAKQRNAVVFVGPPGAGKTTSLAKIAVWRCLAERRSMRIISVDGERVGSHERLRALAGIMGMGFTAANSIAELNDALRDNRGKDCVLIDTPGFSKAEEDAARELASALKRAEPSEVHLVLPACAKRADLAAMSDRFAVFHPTRLLFTRLDETTSVGAVVSEALRLEKPLSFFAAGQAIPDDLEEANPEMLVRRMFAADSAAAVNAA
jgi:flagellar biosynthesis protein FlhF